MCHAQVHLATYPDTTALCQPVAQHSRKEKRMPKRVLGLLFVVVLGLGACEEPPPRVIAEGPGYYQPDALGRATVLFRMLDSVNALRAAAGLVPVALNPYLNAAAATHARDIANQNRPWHFGSDGSSPAQRVLRAGYLGALRGENIAETHETELETLAAWMQEPRTRRVILDRQARDLGFAWFQQPRGKLWWVLITGTPAAAPAPQRQDAQGPR